MCLNEHWFSDRRRHLTTPVSVLPAECQRFALGGRGELAKVGTNRPSAVLHLTDGDPAALQRSTIMTSQLPKTWHAHVAEQTLADAILDRILHNAHRLVLKGPLKAKELEGDRGRTATKASRQGRVGPT